MDSSTTTTTMNSSSRRTDNDAKGISIAMPHSHGNENDEDDGDNDEAEMEHEVGNDEEEEESSSSEYTYETDDDEDDTAITTKGWLSRLFTRQRRADSDDDDDEEEDHEDEDSYDSDDDDEGCGEDRLPAPHYVAGRDDEGTAMENGDTESIRLTGKDRISNTNNNHFLNQEVTENDNEEEEAILMAEAIQRVRQRIQQNGGNLYNVLSEEDKILVDELESRRKVLSSSADNIIDATAMEEQHNNEQIRKIHIPVNHGYDCVPRVTEIGGDSDRTRQDKTTFRPDKDNRGRDQEVNHDDDDGDDTPVEDIVNAAAADDDDDHEDDDEERPTLEEQRSLLTLAAEHDRVDVIQSLLGDSSRHDSIEQCGYDSLLAGISGHDAFVPPPLHVAVAHGSIHAASCLLRMGADPSIRPRVEMSLSSSSMENGGEGGVGGNRNYKKYHDMSAWELAFGSSNILHIDEDEDVGNQIMMEGDDTVAKEEKPAGRWFGFRSSTTKDESARILTDDDADALSSKMGSKNNDRCIQRKRRKQPLNIAPTKLDGIRHAFMSEALRAIGANEVRRLEQLLDSGMDPNLEVMADKTMLQWARDMDALDCCELLLHSGGKGMVEAVVEKQEEERISANDEQLEEATATHQQEQLLPAVRDERISGLSLGDLRMLISENLNLIPQLTSYRDELASETTMCQSLLQDISTTGGKGGLSSHSLLEIVRSLKDQRAQAEESLAKWDSAWEEREDELNFFWEEVLDDNLREEIGAILDQVDLSGEGPHYEPSNQNHGATLEGLIQHFVEVDNRVKSLRASISILAEESAKATAEIESRGMSGALSLTRTLREEVKEIEKKIHEASLGEGACRRKIEIIQRRIDEANSINERSPSRKDGDRDGDDDAITEDFQLRLIVQQHDAKVKSGEERELSPILIDQQQVHSPVDKELTPTSVTAEESVKSTHDVIHSLRTIVEEPIQVENRPEVVMKDSLIVSAVHEESIESSKQNDIDKMETTVVNSTQSRPPKMSQTTVAIEQPSHAISKGMSTAIIVHSPAGQKYGSLSSQIWEILRMIVGLNRVPGTNRSPSLHDDERHPHIMVV